MTSILQSCSGEDAGTEKYANKFFLSLEGYPERVRFLHTNFSSQITSKVILGLTKAITHTWYLGSKFTEFSPSKQKNTTTNYLELAVNLNGVLKKKKRN